MNKVWIFHGEGAKFASAVFANQKDAETWISDNGWTGVLTQYPIDKSVYDWAVESKHFRPDPENPKTGLFVQNFTTASQNHLHFKNGVKD